MIDSGRCAAYGRGGEPAPNWSRPPLAGAWAAVSIHPPDTPALPVVRRRRLVADRLAVGVECVEGSL